MRVELNVNIGGLYLENPLILSSGILGVSPGLLARVANAGAGAVTTKTLTIEPRDGYANPVFVDLGVGYLNAMGLPNPGLKYFLEELEKQRESIKVPVIVSVGGGSLKEPSNLTCPALTPKVMVWRWEETPYWSVKLYGKLGKFFLKFPYS